MKNKGFTYIEVIISITIFLLAIIPTMEFNRYILDIDKKYSAIEKNIKNLDFLEKKIRSKGYKELKNYIGEYEYEAKTDSYEIDENSIFKNLKTPFFIKKGEKIVLKIESLKTIETIENVQTKDVICINIEYQGKYKNLKVMRLISETGEYSQ